MQRVQTLLESFVNSAPKCIRSELPLSFEDIDHPYGFVMYRKILDFDGTNLTAANVKDHGYVFVNELAQVSWDSVCRLQNPPCLGCSDRQSREIFEEMVVTSSSQKG